MFVENIKKNLGGEACFVRLTLGGLAYSFSFSFFFMVLVVLTIVGTGVPC